MWIWEDVWCSSRRPSVEVSIAAPRRDVIALRSRTMSYCTGSGLRYVLQPWRSTPLMPNAITEHYTCSRLAASETVDFRAVLRGTWCSQSLDIRSGRCIRDTIILSGGTVLRVAVPLVRLDVSAFGARQSARVLRETEAIWACLDVPKWTTSDTPESVSGSSPRLRKCDGNSSANSWLSYALPVIRGSELTSIMTSSPGCDPWSETTSVFWSDARSTVEGYGSLVGGLNCDDKLLRMLSHIIDRTDASWLKVWD